MIMKPPYIIAALSAEKMTPEEILLAGHVDHFVRILRTAEVLDIAQNDMLDIVGKHVKAAYEYYSSFDDQDLAMLLMFEHHHESEKEDNCESIL